MMFGMLIKSTSRQQLNPREGTETHMDQLPNQIDRDAGRQQLNPREGTETRPLSRFGPVQSCRQQLNPREGTETQRATMIPRSASLVDSSSIPARGRKRFCRTCEKCSSIRFLSVDSSSIPARGRKHNSEKLLNAGSKVASTAAQSPRGDGNFGVAGRGSPPRYRRRQQLNPREGTETRRFRRPHLGLGTFVDSSSIPARGRKQ